MTSRGETRESTPAVLAIAFGLLVIFISLLSLFGVRMAEVDGEALLDSRFSAHLLPEVLEVFCLHCDEGHPVAEVAAIVGRDRRTVKKWLDEARRAVARVLEGRG